MCVEFTFAAITRLRKNSTVGATLSVFCSLALRNNIDSNHPLVQSLYPLHFCSCLFQYFNDFGKILVFRMR